MNVVEERTAVLIIVPTPMEATFALVDLVIVYRVTVEDAMVCCALLIDMQNHYDIDVFFSDIDECRDGRDNCAQNCSNTLGSFTCSCGDGYRLGLDGYSCSGIYNNYSSLFMLL